MVRRPGQVAVPAESRADVSAHVLWKQDTTTLSEIRIVNLNAGSYLKKTCEEALEKAGKDKKDLYL